MLKLRLITAIALATVFVLALYTLPDLGWSLFLLIFILIGAWEWAGLSGFHSAGKRWFLGLTVLITAALLPGVSEAARHAGAVLLTVAAAGFWIFISPWWLSRRWHLRHPVGLALTGWLLLLPAWMALIDLRHISPAVVLLVILVVAVADSAAYFSGKRFGKRKLAPEISPGKTWEGLVGALFAVTLFGIGLCLWLGWSFWFLPGLWLLTIFSVLGDLFESLIKRQAGKKDSGTILPGHGGVLDRIDGLTPTLPLVAFYAYLPYFVEIALR